MSLGPDHSDDDLALAGEYVLRVLSPEEETAFEARLRDEPALRRLVANWEDQFAPFADEVAEVAPPAQVFRAIEDTLFTDAKPVRTGFGMRFWGSALAGLAMLGAAAVLLPNLLTPVGPGYIAEIAADDASLIVEARFETRSNTLRVARLAGGPRDGRTLELWIIAEGATAPVSLGLIEAAEVELAVNAELRPLLAGAVLAISDEPLGGSPTGAPTGEVLAIGLITEA